MADDVDIQILLHKTSCVKVSFDLICCLAMKLNAAYGTNPHVNLHFYQWTGYSGAKRYHSVEYGTRFGTEYCY
jgi:hypothetical protein